MAMRVQLLHPRHESLKLWKVLQELHETYGLDTVWEDEWAGLMFPSVDHLATRLMTYPAVFLVGHTGVVYVDAERYIHAVLKPQNREERRMKERMAAWDKIRKTLKGLELWPVHCYLNNDAMIRIAKRYGFEVDNGSESREFR